MTEHNDHTSNINESTINEVPEDKQASDDAAAAAQERGEDVENVHRDDRLTPEKIGEAARKVATETAYAAAGFAGMVGDKARAFYDEQKKQYTDAHPDEDGPSAKAFLDQLSEQLNRFADDLSRGYRDMAERGRDVVQGNTAAKRGQTGGTTEQEGSDANAVNDGESAIPENQPTFSSNLANDVTEKAPDTSEILVDADKQDGVL
ncbi:MAG: hypothetical protein ACTHWA_04055 [Arachnia sp.]